MTGLAGVVDVDVFLNALFPVLREVDFQVRTTAMVVTLGDSKTNQLVGAVRVKFGEIPALPPMAPQENARAALPMHS